MRFWEREIHPEKIVGLVRDHVIKLAKKNNPWLLENHLLPAEEQAEQLCSVFSAAEEDVVKLGIWLHDIGKVSDHFESHAEYAADQALLLLRQYRYPQEKLRNVCRICSRHDDDDCTDLTLEEKIVRTADAASHFTQPGFLDAVYEELLDFVDDREASRIMCQNIDSDFYHRISLDLIREDLRSLYEAAREKFTGGVVDRT